jgi:hypothetical protein
MKLKKLLKRVSDNAIVSLGIDGFCVCTLNAKDIPDSYEKFEVIHIWLGVTQCGTPKLNIELKEN